jgi:hypothetical protein
MRYFALLLLVAAGADSGKSDSIPAPVECPPEAMKHFGTKVQPLLANACAACHSTTGCGSFSLRRATPGSAVPTATTQYNIAAAAGQIDKANPERSKLLIKAISAHGGLRQPPIKDANAAAYKNLEQWVKLMANNGKAPTDSKSPSKDGDKPIDPFDPAIFNNKNG